MLYQIFNTLISTGDTGILGVSIALGLCALIVLIMLLVAFRHSGRVFVESEDISSEITQEIPKRRELPEDSFEIKALSGKNSALEREIEILKKQLEEAKASARKTEDLSDSGLEAKLSGLEEENGRFKKEIDELQGKLEDATKNSSVLHKKLEEASKKIEEAGKPAAGSGEDASKIKELTEKINFLESQLSEYEVIEEDIANLKSLQEEKAKLLEKIKELEAEGDSGEAPLSKPLEESFSSTESVPELEKPEVTGESTGGATEFEEDIEEEKTSVDDDLSSPGELDSGKDGEKDDPEEGGEENSEKSGNSTSSGIADEFEKFLDDSSTQ